MFTMPIFHGLGNCNQFLRKALSFKSPLNDDEVRKSYVPSIVKLFLREYKATDIVRYTLISTCILRTKKTCINILYPLHYFCQVRLLRFFREASESTIYQVVCSIYTQSKRFSYKTQYYIIRKVFANMWMDI